MELAGGGRIRDLLLEDLKARGARLECGPVGCRAEKRLVLLKYLMGKDVYAAGEIALRIQYGPAWIVRRQVFIGRPVKVAAVALTVLIGKLQESLLVNDAMCYVIGDGDLRLGMTDIRG